MAIVIDEQIFWFEVSINDVLLMEVHQAIEDLNKVESSIFFVHSFNSFEVIEQLSSGAI
jgi:hypothetical protein